MAKIGLKGFWIGKYSESNGTLTYTAGKKIAKAVNLSENKTIDEAKLYADNALDDSVYAIKEMTVDVTPNGIEDTDLSVLLGQTAATVTINGEEKELTATSVSNEGAAVGFAYIISERISGAEKQKVVIYPKIKFKPSENAEYKTKGESTEFTTPSYKGTCYPAVNDSYYVFEDKFDTEAEAEAFIEEIFAINAI